jgi:hypothetical protein
VSLSLATLGLATTAHAIVICFDYALYRAARFSGIPGCDVNPPGVSTYLTAREMKGRLKVLGYEPVSGPDPLSFGNRMFNTPGFAEEFLAPNDVVFMRDEHVGYVGGVDFSTSPITPLIDHYIQLPSELRTATSHAVDNLPASQITKINDLDAHAGLWLNDPVQEFLHKRTFAQGGGVEVWRRVREPDANAQQMVCAPPGTPSELVLRLKTAGATCEVKWTIGKSDQAPKAYCRSTLDGPPAPNSAQLNVAADGSGPGTTAEATWEGFQNSRWNWIVQIRYATFQGQGDNKCMGTDASCSITIPPRPAGTGPAPGREYVGVDIGWDAASGPGNPGVGLPAGLNVGSLGIEQGIDYRQ